MSGHLRISKPLLKHQSCTWTLAAWRGKGSGITRSHGTVAAAHDFRNNIRPAFFLFLLLRSRFVIVVCFGSLFNCSLQTRSFVSRADWPWVNDLPDISGATAILCAMFRDSVDVSCTSPFRLSHVRSMRQKVLRSWKRADHEILTDVTRFHSCLITMNCCPPTFL